MSGDRWMRQDDAGGVRGCEPPAASRGGRAELDRPLRDRHPRREAKRQRQYSRADRPSQQTRSARRRRPAGTGQVAGDGLRSKCGAGRGLPAATASPPRPPNALSRCDETNVELACFSRRAWRESGVEAASRLITLGSLQRAHSAQPAGHVDFAAAGGAAFGRAAGNLLVAIVGIAPCRIIGPAARGDRSDRCPADARDQGDPALRQP